KMLVSVTPQGKIIDFAILSSNETPGLGDNAGKDAFRSEFKGKKSEDLKVVNPKVRVPVYITSVATIVTVVQLVLQAYAPLLYKAVGIYLALIVVFAI